MNSVGYATQMTRKQAFVPGYSNLKDAAAAAAAS